MGVLPPHEGLHASDAPARQLDLRLIVKDQLVLVDRAPQLTDERQPKRVIRVLAGVIDRIAEVHRLCDVHRDVGTLDQTANIRSMGWVKGDAEYDKGWGKVVTYQCRNCGKKDQKYMYFWGDAGFLKVGQIPELREAIDPRLDAALAESSGLYQKAVRSRSLGFGIGALAYLRRIVEDRTDELMELLRANKWDEWTQEEKEQFEVARTTYQYSQKIAYATEKILPPAMSAEGRDSFAALHDVTSNGFHGKTEEKCIEIFDRCNLIFAYSFRVLSGHKREREEFRAKLQALNE